MVCAGLFDGRRGLGAVEGVEAAGDLAGEFDVGDLILADGDVVRLVEEDVGRLEERVAEEAVCVEVFSRSCSCWSFYVGTRSSHGQRGEHAEEGKEFGVLGDVGLDEDRRALGVEAGGEEVQGDVTDVLAEGRGVGVVGGEGVKVCDEEVAVVLVLEPGPVVERAHVVAEVQAAGWAHAGEDAGA